MVPHRDDDLIGLSETRRRGHKVNGVRLNRCGLLLRGKVKVLIPHHERIERIGF